MKTPTPPYVGKFIIANGKFLECSNYNFDSAPGHLSVYEVIRLIDGVPLFLEDHLGRLMNSIQLINRKPDISFAGIADEIIWLSAQNKFRNGNVKIVCNFPPKKNTPDSVFIFFIPHQYPEKEKYLEGFKLQSRVMERPNPNAKIINTTLTQEVIDLKAQNDLDEILLVNHDNIVTEGSKSNIFFVRDNEILTTGRDLVLAGITRDKVIEICKHNGIVCKETKIHLEELSKMAGAFITGTSPKIMPVNRINQVGFQVQHPLIIKIKKLYDEMISNYLEDYKRKNKSSSNITTKDFQ